MTALTLRVFRWSPGEAERSSEYSSVLREYQRRTSQWTIGKNFDGTGGFGGGGATQPIQDEPGA